MWMQQKRQLGGKNLPPSVSDLILSHLTRLTIMCLGSQQRNGKEYHADGQLIVLRSQPHCPWSRGLHPVEKYELFLISHW